METADVADDRSPPDGEPVMDCHLELTTLSGTVIKISMCVGKFDRLMDLERGPYC